MAYARNLHKVLFEAVEQRYNEDADLLQLCEEVYRDFVPSEVVDAKNYPFCRVSQGQEGGQTQVAATTAGLVPVDESFVIVFEVAASTTDQAEQIAWQLCQAFDGWTGDYTGVTIKESYRSAPPWVQQTGEGVCESSVTFLVSAESTQE